MHDIVTETNAFHKVADSCDNVLSLKEKLNDKEAIQIEVQRISNIWAKKFPLVYIANKKHLIELY